MIEDVIVVGGGPAGSAAALQLVRLGHHVTLVESGRIGGMLWEADLIENYPGFPDGISGSRLAGLLEQHLRELKVDLVPHHVAKAAFTAGKYALKLSNGQTLLGTVLVLATGTVPGNWEMPPLSGEVDPYIFREISSISNRSGMLVAVVGGGDTAFSYALSLARNNTVHLYTRSEGEGSAGYLRARVGEHPSIHWHTGAYLGKIEGLADQLRLSWIGSSGTWTSDVDALVPAVGRVENDRLYRGFSESLRERLLTEGRLHMIGDVVHGQSRQAAISVGDGMRAAMEIDRLLTREKVD